VFSCVVIEGKRLPIVDLGTLMTWSITCKKHNGKKGKKDVDYIQTELVKLRQPQQAIILKDIYNREKSMVMLFIQKYGVVLAFSYIQQGEAIINCL
jgi:hypothetical protein